MLPKEQNKSLITNPKEMEIYELPDQKIVTLRLSELQENTTKLWKWYMEKKWEY